MQIDFHHAITYVLARLSGFPHQDACTIAYAAQYVDDATNQGEIHFRNHEPYDHIASAHPVVPTSVEDAAGFAGNFYNSLNAEAWIPFHFLPGNGGLPAGKGTEYPMLRRLVCQPDSAVAQRMLAACLTAKEGANGLHRLGITAHVYADTFVHFDFLGLKDEVNRVQRLIHAEAEGFHAYEEDAESRMAAALPLGHGMALTLPDQPFRRWGYVDRDGNSRTRDNPGIFLRACERLLDLFSYYRGGSGGNLLEQDRALLRWGFSAFTDEKGEARHEAWLALLAGKMDGRAFSFGVLGGEETEGLRYLPKGKGSWKHKALGTESDVDEPGEMFTYSQAFEASDWKRFHDALKEHRAEVLNRILPQDFGLQIPA